MNFSFVEWQEIGNELTKDGKPGIDGNQLR